MSKKPMIILSGPTAVGKTALSIELAKQVNGAIISADSMQVYKHMDIGSAKIIPEEMCGIKHYLIDALEPSEEFNIVVFQKMAKDALDEINEREELENDLLEARLKLQNALDNKTTKILKKQADGT